MTVLPSPIEIPLNGPMVLNDTELYSVVFSGIPLALSCKVNMECLTNFTNFTKPKHTIHDFIEMKNIQFCKKQHQFQLTICSNRENTTKACQRQCNVSQSICDGTWPLERRSTSIKYLRQVVKTQGLNSGYYKEISKKPITPPEKSAGRGDWLSLFFIVIVVFFSPMILTQRLRYLKMSR